MRSYLADYHQKHYGFRLRGQHITRVEGFSDAVFAIAITLLIFANSVPDSYTLIQESMRDIVPFGLCMALLVSLWYAHFSFYIRYGLEDARMVALNTLFLFLLLVYVFPLKFLASFLFEVYSVLFFKVFVEPASSNEKLMQMVRPQDIGELMAFYSGGIALLYFTLFLMYRYTLSMKQPLELSDRECFETKVSMYNQLAMATVPFLSVLCALLIRSTSGPMIAGFVYFLYFPVTFGFFAYAKKIRNRYLAKKEHPSATTPD